MKSHSKIELARAAGVSVAFFNNYLHMLKKYCTFVA